MFTLKKILRAVQKNHKTSEPGELGKLDAFPCSKNLPGQLHLLKARNNSIQMLLLPYLTNANKPEFIYSFQQTVPHCEPGTLGARKVIRTANMWRRLLYNLIPTRHAAKLYAELHLVLMAVLWENLLLSHFTEKEVKALGVSNLSKVTELANGKLRPIRLQSPFPTH